MNYLEKFESYNINDIHEICEEYGIVDYKINSDGTIDVTGNVDFSCMRLTELPIRFNIVDGYFNCSENYLTTLEGAPKIVTYSFDCSDNNLLTLQHSPKEVTFVFDCSSNILETLEGAPEEINEFNCSFNNLKSLRGAPIKAYDFKCSKNNLITLEGAPKIIDNDFDCSDNQLTTLEYAPIKVGGIFDCSDNLLTTLKGAPIEVGDMFDCSYNEYLITLEGAPRSVFEFSCEDTPVYKVYVLFDEYKFVPIINDFKILNGNKVDIELLNGLLYDFGKPEVNKVDGYINI